MINDTKEEITKFLFIGKDYECLTDYDLVIVLGNNFYKETALVLKKLYDDERTSYKKFKDEVTEKETKGKKIEVFKKLLQQAGVSAKRIDAVIKVSDDVINNIEFNEKGEVKDVDKITEGIKSEWSDFIMKPEQIKADIPSPPVLGGDTGNTKEHRAAKIAAEYHKSLYGDSGVQNGEVNTTQTQNKS